LPGNEDLIIGIPDLTATSYCLHLFALFFGTRKSHFTKF